jgi:hypothetical protein
MPTSDQPRNGHPAHPSGDDTILVTPHLAMAHAHIAWLMEQAADDPAKPTRLDFTADHVPHLLFILANAFMGWVEGEPVRAERADMAARAEDRPPFVRLRRPAPDAPDASDAPVFPEGQH